MAQRGEKAVKIGNMSALAVSSVGNKRVELVCRHGSSIALPAAAWELMRSPELGIEVLLIAHYS